LNGATGKRYVLVAEDDADIAFVVADVLLMEGYDVEVTAGEKTLEIMARRRPDVLLLDFQMPGMDGATIARRVHEDPALRDVPIVAMTAATRAAELCARMGANGCIGKPFDVDELLMVVADLRHTTHD
jgi:CheY-like chemotaxis protein